MEKAARAAQLLAVVCLSQEDAPRVRSAFQRYRQAKPDSIRSWSLFFLARTLGQLCDPEAVAVLFAALDQLQKLAAAYPEVATPRTLRQACARIRSRRP